MVDLMKALEKMMISDKTLRVFLAYKKDTKDVGKFPTVNFLRDYLRSENVEIITDYKDIESCDVILLVTLKLFSKVRGAAKEFNKKIIAIPFGDHANFKKKKNELILTNMKCLNQVDLICVETKGQMEFLKKSSVVTPISISWFSKPMNQRTSISSLEKTTFNKYFGISNDSHSIIVLGCTDSFKKAQSLARMAPGVTFVFVDISSGSLKHRWITEKFPNLYYEIGMRDELYPSGIASASAVVILERWFMDMIVILDAIVSNVPILAVDIPLVGTEIQAGTDFIAIEESPVGIYESLQDLKHNPISDVASSDLLTKIKNDENHKFIDVIKNEIVSPKEEK